MIWTHHGVCLFSALKCNWRFGVLRVKHCVDTQNAGTPGWRLALWLLHRLIECGLEALMAPVLVGGWWGSSLWPAPWLLHKSLHCWTSASVPSTFVFLRAWIHSRERTWTTLRTWTTSLLPESVRFCSLSSLFGDWLSFTHQHVWTVFGGENWHQWAQHTFAANYVFNNAFKFRSILLLHCTSIPEWFYCDSSAMRKLFCLWHWKYFDWTGPLQHWHCGSLCVFTVVFFNHVMETQELSSRSARTLFSNSCFKYQRVNQGFLLEAHLNECHVCSWCSEAFHKTPASREQRAHRHHWHQVLAFRWKKKNSIWLSLITCNYLLIAAFSLFFSVVSKSSFQQEFLAVVTTWRWWLEMSCIPVCALIKCKQ